MTNGYRFVRIEEDEKRCVNWKTAIETVKSAATAAKQKTNPKTAKEQG